MPTWGEVLREINVFMAANPGVNPFDPIRRKYLVELSSYTKRNTILYASRWTQGGVTDPSLVSIGAEDVHAFMEVVHGLDIKKGLDLVLHSPGGSPEAAEAIVHYLRSRFKDIRVIVPQAAMSAATMLSCAANEIVMGAHSQLGPIDPQMIIQSPNGGYVVAPAKAIIDQFDMARQDCQDPKRLGAWIPILPQYGPALLKQCENALALAEELATEWLKSWMFARKRNRDMKAAAIAKTLSDHTQYKSHGRPIHRDAAIAMGLNVRALEKDQKLQDLVLSVHHATMHVFTMLGHVAKIVENHLGRAFVKSQQVLQIQPQLVVQPPQLPQPPAPAKEVHPKKSNGSS